MGWSRDRDNTCLLIYLPLSLIKYPCHASSTSSSRPLSCCHPWPRPAHVQHLHHVMYVVPRHDHSYYSYCHSSLLPPRPAQVLHLHHGRRAPAELRERDRAGRGAHRHHGHHQHRAQPGGGLRAPCDRLPLCGGALWVSGMLTCPPAAVNSPKHYPCTSQGDLKSHLLSNLPAIFPPC